MEADGEVGSGMQVILHKIEMLTITVFKPCYGDKGAGMLQQGTIIYDSCEVSKSVPSTTR